MPVLAFTTSATSGLLNVLNNKCEISTAWDPRTGGSQPTFVTFDAIWDTGATHSAITQKVIDDCGLVPTGIARVHGVHGVAQTDTYLVNIALPNKLVFFGVRVTKGDFVGGDILIGMNIINKGDFAVTNHNGTTKFSFRVPSQGHIDFVQEIDQAAPSQGPGRAERRRQAGKARGR